jgi:hypothetical protein
MLRVFGDLFGGGGSVPKSCLTWQSANIRVDRAGLWRVIKATERYATLLLSRLNRASRGLGGHHSAEATGPGVARRPHETARRSTVTFYAREISILQHAPSGGNVRSNGTAQLMRNKIADEA